MGAAADGRVYMVSSSHLNLPGDIGKIVTGYKKKLGDDMYTGAVFHAFTMLSEGFAKAKSTDPAKVARVLEGMKFNSFNGEVEMRKTDHQLQQGLFISKWTKAEGKYPNDAENTGYTFVPVKYYEPYVASTPTSCQMKRPS